MAEKSNHSIPYKRRREYGKNFVIFLNFLKEEEEEIEFPLSQELKIPIAPTPVLYASPKKLSPKKEKLHFKPPLPVDISPKYSSKFLEMGHENILKEERRSASAPRRLISTPNSPRRNSPLSPRRLFASSPNTPRIMRKNQSPLHAYFKHIPNKSPIKGNKSITPKKKQSFIIEAKQIDKDKGKSDETNDILAELYKLNPSTISYLASLIEKLMINEIPNDKKNIEDHFMANPKIPIIYTIDNHIDEELKLNTALLDEMDEDGDELLIIEEDFTDNEDDQREKINPTPGEHQAEPNDEVVNRGEYSHFQERRFENFSPNLEKLPQQYTNETTNETKNETKNEMKDKVQKDNEMDTKNSSSFDKEFSNSNQHSLLSSPRSEISQDSQNLEKKPKKMSKRVYRILKQKNYVDMILDDIVSKDNQLKGEKISLIEENNLNK